MLRKSTNAKLPPRRRKGIRSLMYEVGRLTKITDKAKENKERHQRDKLMHFRRGVEKQLSQF